MLQWCEVSLSFHFGFDGHKDLMGWLTKDKRKTKSRVDPYCHYWSSAKWLLRVGSVLYFTMPKGVLK